VSNVVGSVKPFKQLFLCSIFFLGFVLLKNVFLFKNETFIIVQGRQYMSMAKCFLKPISDLT